MVNSKHNIIVGTENEDEATIFTIIEDENKNAKIFCTTGLYLIMFY